MEGAFWYPGEESCSIYRDEWIIRQRKIGRKLGKKPDAGAFSAEMLAHGCRITRGLKGLCAERELSEARIQEWKQRHPAITDEERAAMKVRGLRKAALQGGFTRSKGPIISAGNTHAAETVSEVGGGA